MKLTSSARTFSAAMIRSPSFSRSSSSMITAILPRRRSSRILSIVLNAAIGALGVGFSHESFKIARHDVNFDVYFIVDPQLPQSRLLERMRNDVDIKAQAFDPVDRQADAVDANRALRGHKSHQLRGQLELHAPGARVLSQPPQHAECIDVAADHVAAKRVARPQTGLEVDV